MSEKRKKMPNPGTPALRFTLTTLCCFLLLSSLFDSMPHADDECVIRMGYRTNKREPLIKKNLTAAVSIMIYTEWPLKKLAVSSK